MVLKRLGLKINSHVFLIILAVALALPPYLYSAITPDREIVTVDAPDTPLWKSYWDAGRDLARQGNYVAAAEYYKELLLKKPRIEEAKWEYCKILFTLEEFDLATSILESLIEGNPYSLEYISMAGHVALRTKEYRRAVKYLGQVYSREPGGDEGVLALKGLVDGLLGLGRDAQAFTLLEQLRQRKPDDTRVLEMLAHVAQNLGQFRKSSDYYSLLLNDAGLEKEQLQKAAELFVQAGEKEKALPVWKRILEKDPDNITYHLKACNYFLDTGNSRLALPHILSILNNDKHLNQNLLLTAARIYVRDFGRADKALRFYERYTKLVPKDKQAAKELDIIRDTIANDLLAIVENNGAEILWNDLLEFTDNRLSIYRLMAKKLEHSGKTKALTSLLEVIYTHSRNKDDVAYRLAEIYFRTGDSSKANVYLKNIKGNMAGSASYYLLKAMIEEQAGDDIRAFYSSMEAWKSSRELGTLYTKLLRQAGDFGLLKELIELSRPLTATSLEKKYLDLYLLYIEGLRLNGQYSVAESIYSRMLNTDWAGKEGRIEILLHRAVTLKMMGANFESEKILRSLLISDGANKATIFQLIEHAIDSGVTEDGWSLFRYFGNDPAGKSWQEQTDPASQDLFETYIHLLESEEEYSVAADEVELYIKQKQTAINSKERNSLLSRFEQELCRLYIIEDEYELCSDVLVRSEKAGRNITSSEFIRAIVKGKGRVDISRYFQNSYNRKDAVSIARIYTDAENAVELGQERVALEMYNKILASTAQSPRARIAQAERLNNLGQIDSAAETYKQLHAEYPQEIFFYKRYLQLEFKQANYSLVIAELTDKKIAQLPIEFKLLETRTYWAMGDYDKALSLYRELLNPPVVSLFKQRLSEKKLDFRWQEEDKKIFWKLFTYKEPDQLDKLNSMTADHGFLFNIETAVGEIAADLYDRYRWEKLVKSEYMVRKAVKQNKYITAEKNYRHNLREYQSAEGLKDLAKIYERLGDYRKEAEVYSYLEAQGEKYPELDESIERNKITRSPTLGLEYVYLSKEGRDDSINVVKTGVGPSFRFNPDITSQIEFNYNELEYQKASGDGEIEGRVIHGKSVFDINNRTTVDLGLGYHYLDSGGNGTLLSDMKVQYQLDDMLSGYVRYQQDVVDDTLESLESDLYSQEISGGLLIEGSSGFNLGGEYRKRWYNDDNSQNRIYLWTTYSIFSEFTTVELKYSYELVNSSLDSMQIDTLDGSESTGDAVDINIPVTLDYWSPDDYWQHLVSVRFHHLLKQLDVFEKAPSYYSLGFSVGYEMDETFIYSGNFDIFLEMSSNFLLKGELLYSTSDDYREHSAGLSLMYRW